MKRERTLGIVLHHAASVETATAEDINRYHAARGWRCAVRVEEYDDPPPWVAFDGRGAGTVSIGYHVYVRPDGTIEPGRPLDAIGSHCSAQMRNLTHVGVCVGGNREAHPLPAVQRNSLVIVLAGLCLRYGLDVDAIEPHGQVPGAFTDCPGRHVLDDLHRIRRDVAGMMI